MLKKAFSRQLEGQIWKLGFDEEARRLVLEVRVADRKEAFFSCIDTLSGRFSFHGLRLQTPWFCGLEGAHHGFAYLHGYLSETLPGHRGVFAYRLDNGQLAWEDYNLVYGHPCTEGIVAWNYKSEPRKYQLIDPGTGMPLKTFPSRLEMERETSLLPQANILLPENKPLPGELAGSIPAAAPPGDLPAEGLAGELPQGKPASPPSPRKPAREFPAGSLPEADLLYHNGLCIFTLYTRQGTAVDQRLYVLDREHRVVHEDILAENILQPALETFFVTGEQLYYIKRKSEILSYFL